MDLGKKRILVTGSSGFIGSHLVEELVKKGALVRCFVKYNSNHDIENLRKISSEALKKVEIFMGDLKNIESVNNSMKGVDVVFHLGAQISIPYSYEDPRDFLETNVLGTLNVLEAAKQNKVERIVVTSTSEVYGTALYTPIDEKHPLQPQSPYAASKVGADKLAESFQKTYNLPITIIRPFNTYGPRQSMRAVIPTIIVQALTKDKIKIGSLTPKRDFNYVKDTVDGFIKIAESPDTIGKTVNVGSGRAVSIGEIIEMIKKILGKDFKVEIDDERKRPENSEVMVLLSNNSLAKDLMSWEPKTSLEEGLKESINYVRENIKDYNPDFYHV
ncbi:MAG: SDR family NAD(P)-dependent oxidoreductase [Nanoarchaeota archaeon]